MRDLWKGASHILRALIEKEIEGRIKERKKWHAVKDRQWGKERERW